MVNYKTKDDTNISCNVKKACRCPPPPHPPPKKIIWNATFNVAYMIKPRQSTIDQNEMYVNAIQGTFFQVFRVFYVMRKFLSRKGGGFSANNLDVWARLQMSPVLRSRSSVKVHFRRISCLLEVFWIIGRSLPNVNRQCMYIFHVCFTTNLCLFVCFLFCQILRQIALRLRWNGLFPLAFDCYHLKLDDETNKTRNVPHSCMLGIFPNKVVIKNKRKRKCPTEWNLNLSAIGVWKRGLFVFTCVWCGCLFLRP